MPARAHTHTHQGLLPSESSQASPRLSLQRFVESSHKVGSPLSVEKYIPGHGRQWVKVQAVRVKEIPKVNPDYAKHGLQMAVKAVKVSQALNQLVHTRVNATGASSPRPL